MDGGVISQQAIHHIDALRWFFGEIESVEAQCATRLVRMECEDLCVASLRFQSGALGIIEAMTAARRLNPRIDSFRQQLVTFGRD